MVIAKQIEIRNNIKKYFDMAYEGDTVIVPRKQNRNVVIISEQEYSRLNQEKRVGAYARAIGESVKNDNLAKLQAISELADNWNQNGAPAFSRALIEKVRIILEGVSIQPEIFPTAVCTIQLEYDNSRRDHMEIEIGESETAEVFISAYDKRELFESISATAEAINTRVGEFYG